MTETFQEQVERYKQQQTVSGKRTQQALEKMVNQMQKVTNHPLKSGSLTPVIDCHNNTITSFIER